MTSIDNQNRILQTNAEEPKTTKITKSKDFIDPSTRDFTNSTECPYPVEIKNTVLKILKEEKNISSVNNYRDELINLFPNERELIQKAVRMAYSEKDKKNVIQSIH